MAVMNQLSWVSDPEMTLRQIKVPQHVPNRHAQEWLQS